MAATAHFHTPGARDARYGSPLNVAQYLVDLHDAGPPCTFAQIISFNVLLHIVYLSNFSSFFLGGVVFV